MISEAIGENFAVVNGEFLPKGSKHYLRHFPQVIVAIKNKEKASIDFCILLDHKAATDALLNGTPMDESLLKEWFALLCFLKEVVACPNLDYIISAVSVGSQSIRGEVNNLALSSYNGIFCTFAMEYPTVKIRLFDADMSLAPEAVVESILRFLKRPYRREGLAEREGKLLQPVLTQTSLIRTKAISDFTTKGQLSDAGVMEVPQFEIHVGRARDFDDLNFVRQTIRAIGPHEVDIEIHSVALNYRDVMKVLGEYPLDGGDYAYLGDECSGVIKAVGKSVDRSLMGCRVMVLGERLLASRAIVHSSQVISNLGSIGLNEAATIPVAYLTAHYSLVTLGKIQAGERVLIHSAAGGVGLAAIKVAKAHGATVFATASLPKQDIVRHWGADYIYDSRRLDFERQILEDTSGEGVDVVLNSLSGAYQLASVRLLSDFGRFVEIGKRDIYESRTLNQYDLRHNVSFHVVDMSKLLRSNPSVLQGLLVTVRKALEKKEYIPLPYRVYRSAHVGQALRTMAMGRHIGKILVSMRDTAVVPVDPPTWGTDDQKEKTLIITGGVSGVGFEIAKSIVLTGAGNVILSSRSDPESPAVIEAIRDLSSYKTSRVSFVQCDTTSLVDVKRLIAVATRESNITLGIIHAAGVYDDRPIYAIDWDSFRHVCAPKVLGSFNLHKATLGIRLYTFCLVSSVASMLGSTGQCSYAAANSFLDGLAHFRKSQGLVATSVNFGPFEDIGFLADKPNVRSLISRQGTNFVPKYLAIKAMENAIAMGLSHAGVFDIDWRRWRSQMRFEEVPDMLKAVVADSNTDDEGAGRLRIDILKDLDLAVSSERQMLIETYICRLLANILSTEPDAIDPILNLSSQGLDSLSTVELALSIQDGMKFNMTPEEFQDVQNVRSLAKLLLDKYHTIRGTT